MRNTPQPEVLKESASKSRQKDTGGCDSDKGRPTDKADVTRITSQTRNSISDACGDDPGMSNYKSDLQFYGGEEGGGDGDDGEWMVAMVYVSEAEGF